MIDSHTHIQFPEFEADRDAVIRRALEAGIGMVNVGTNVESSKKAMELAHKYNEGVYATVGIHPHDAEAGYDFSQIKELARDPKVVGIGETGLDYYCSQEVKSQKSKVESKNAKQKELFIKHIELAQKVGKPLIIHCREAHCDLLNLLLATRYSLPARSGVMHFFGGDDAWENLDEYLKMGFYISLAGVITFKNYKDIERVKKIPSDRVLIETDAPYATPEPYRGKRNEPLFIKHTAEKLAEIKGVSFEDITSQIYANANKLFKI